MFYSNNDSYMQDLYFYNQIPNNAYMYDIGNSMTGIPNIQMMPTNPITNNMMYKAPGFVPNNYSGANLNNLYPSIYRIINPVISRVVSNNNQPITEELLNNMTDTVFNIVEGQIDFSDDQVQKVSQTENSNSSNTNQSRSPESIKTINNQTQSKSNRNDYLLKDFIKTLIIKELLFKNQMYKCNSNIGMPQTYIPYSNNFNF